MTLQTDFSDFLKQMIFLMSLNSLLFMLTITKSTISRHVHVYSQQAILYLNKEITT